jgi:hypothetical protein
VLTLKSKDLEPELEAQSKLTVRVHRSALSTVPDSSMPSIRAACAADAEAICLIYNQGIEDRLATLETERARRRSEPRGSRRAGRAIR